MAFLKLSLAVVILLCSCVSSARAASCPPEIERAREMLKQEENLQLYRGRPLAGATLTVDVRKVARLIEEAEAAWRAGDMEKAKARASAALSAMQ